LAEGGEKLQTFRGGGRTGAFDRARGMTLKATQAQDLRDLSQCWRFCFGAEWLHPLGPESSRDGLDDYPVVQVAHADGLRPLGKTLPTESGGYNRRFRGAP
jgi:hypothetical protein